jgi:2-iminobutanoate/2-iminopropanoate deaminase
MRITNEIKQSGMKRIISTTAAPGAIGPYSQAVEANGTLYISGQVAIDPATGRMIDGGITEQTTRVLNNIKAILLAAGYTLDNVVKSTCLLSDMSDFKAMNEVYAKFYTSDQPARAAFAVKGLPLDALIEIETIAVR